MKYLKEQMLLDLKVYIIWFNSLEWYIYIYIYIKVLNINLILNYSVNSLN